MAAEVVHVKCFLQLSMCLSCGALPTLTTCAWACVVHVALATHCGMSSFLSLPAPHHPSWPQLALPV